MTAAPGATIKLTIYLQGQNTYFGMRCTPVTDLLVSISHLHVPRSRHELVKQTMTTGSFAAQSGGWTRLVAQP